MLEHIYNYFFGQSKPKKKNPNIKFSELVSIMRNVNGDIKEHAAKGQMVEKIILYDNTDNESNPHFQCEVIYKSFKYNKN